jgi:hypothetical protein
MLLNSRYRGPECPIGPFASYQRNAHRLKLFGLIDFVSSLDLATFGRPFCVTALRIYQT